MVFREIFHRPDLTPVQNAVRNSAIATALTAVALWGVGVGEAINNNNSEAAGAFIAGTILAYAGSIAMAGAVPDRIQITVVNGEPPALEESDFNN